MASRFFVLMAGPVLSSVAWAADCDAVIGDWTWFTGGRVTIEAKGGLKYDGAPAGSWECADAARNVVTIHWTKAGTIDKLTMAGDGRSLAGKNAAGVAVSAQRVAATGSTPSSGGPAPVLPKIVAQKIFKTDPDTERLFQQAERTCNLDTNAGCAKALPLVQQAADRGYARAQSMLGIMYRGGHGTPKDLSKAAFWLERAAAQGHRAAEFLLGDMYEAGDGVPADMRRAATYYDGSARQGFGDSQFALGLMYEAGSGVTRSRDLAVFWLSHAAAQGDDQARVIRDILKNPRTPHFQTVAEFGAYLRQQLAPAARSGSSAGQLYMVPGMPSADWYGKKNALTGQNCSNPSCR